jgi:hypothetical protein
MEDAHADKQKGFFWFYYSGYQALRETHRQRGDHTNPLLSFLIRKMAKGCAFIRLSKNPGLTPSK